MNPQDLRNLQESYYEIYEESLITKDPNRLAQKMGARARKHVKANPGKEKEIISRYLDTVETLARRAGPTPQGFVAQPSRYFRKGYDKGVKKEDIDIILGYLLYEGYTDTLESAEAILENMSEDWLESIVEEVLEEELTGERKRIALKKGYKHLATAREGSTVTKNRDSNRPLKRSGYGSKGGSRYGLPMGALPGVAKAQMYSDTNRPDSDRGSGNKAARRAGKKVKDGSRYYWNDKSPDF